MSRAGGGRWTLWSRERGPGATDERRRPHERTRDRPARSPCARVPGSERHEDAERRAGQPAQRACRRDRGSVDPEDPGERPRKDKRERHSDHAADHDDRVADHEVSSAPPEEHRELHHAISDNRIRKGQREEIEREDRTDPYPERQGQDLDCRGGRGTRCRPPGRTLRAHRLPSPRASRACAA